MIIGVTHDPDGRVVQRLSVSTKVSIGLPPNGDRNHPIKLDHFVFLRKKKTANRVEWEIDPALLTVVLGQFRVNLPLDPVGRLLLAQEDEMVELRGVVAISIGW